MTAASVAERAGAESVLESVSRRRRSRFAAFRQRNLLAGGAIVFAIVLVAILAPLVAPRGAQETDYNARLKPPSREHVLGTDNLGKDIFSRVIYGARIDLQVGILSVLSPFLIGIFLGCIAGYYGGKIDTLLMRVVDIVQAFPFLILVIAIVAVLGPGLRNMYIAVAMVAWVSYARLLRGEILVAKHREYVEAAQAMGMRDPRIIGRHILPNVISSALVYAMADVILYIVLAASLSYLGLGARPPAPEWGAMITEGRTFMATAWWMSVFPGLAIVVTGIGFSLLGDGLADALRPSRR
ncbi:MAG: peptide/nickel transport system permease protein [Thermomicrobiales bacterium]|jgi:peptide/nickel transport system permease protein|nr:peptide/nickel transport system permease protein [Thermomicrobiales bacterium]